MKTFKVINKWNGKTYTAEFLEVGCGVKLTRKDGSKFTIAMVDFKFNYREVVDD